MLIWTILKAAHWPIRKKLRSDIHVRRRILQASNQHTATTYLKYTGSVTPEVWYSGMRRNLQHQPGENPQYKKKHKMPSRA